MQKDETIQQVSGGVKEGARVLRKSRPGARGLVVAIREETRPSKLEGAPKSLIVQVHWDNGTLSYVDFEAIALVD